METTKPLCGLTAGNLMNDDRVTIPRRMPMREAAQLLHRAEAHSAPVVDESGRCVGILSARDFLRWAEEGGSYAEECHTSSCYHQTKGLVPGSPGAVSCTLAEKSCVLQVMTPTPDGRRVALCRDPHSYWSESQMSGGPPTGEESGRYMTTDHLTAGLRTPLTELARMMIAARDHRVHILDDDGRPAGVVLGTDLLALVSWDVSAGADSRPAEPAAPHR